MPLHRHPRHEDQLLCECTTLLEVSQQRILCRHGGVPAGRTYTIPKRKEGSPRVRVIVHMLCLLLRLTCTIPITKSRHSVTAEGHTRRLRARNTGRVPNHSWCLCLGAGAVLRSDGDAPAVIDRFPWEDNQEMLLADPLGDGRNFNCLPIIFTQPPTSVSY